MSHRFWYLPFVSKLHEVGALERLLGPYLAMLNEWGGTRVNEGQPTPDGSLVWLVGTGGTERQILQRWAELRHRDAPVLLLAHPGHNSLAAALEVLARLHQEGATGRVLFIDVGEPTSGPRLDAALHELDVERRLRSTRIGLIGAPSDWLVASSPDPRIVRDVWGPAVLPIAAEALLMAVEQANGERIDEIASSFTQRAERMAEPDLDAVRNAVRVYLAMRDIVNRSELDAVAVRCFDLVTERGMTACFALSRLSEEGIVAGCEGDVTTTVGMLWAQALVGVVPWMANVARADEARHALWLAHCTVPLHLVQRYAIRSHFESGRSVAIQGTFATGPVTLLRIGGPRLERLWICEGELMQSGHDESLCRTQVHVRLPQGTVGALLRAPLGNHVVLLPGHHEKRLMSFWKFAIEPRTGAAAYPSRDT